MLVKITTTNTNTTFTQMLCADGTRKLTEYVNKNLDHTSIETAVTERIKFLKFTRIPTDRQYLQSFLVGNKGFILYSAISKFGNQNIRHYTEILEETTEEIA